MSEEHCLTRRVRRWLTRGIQTAGLRIAPAMPDLGIRAVERALGRAGPFVPILARQVAENSPCYLDQHMNRPVPDLESSLRVAFTNLPQ